MSPETLETACNRLTKAACSGIEAIYGDVRVLQRVTKTVLQAEGLGEEAMNTGVANELQPALQSLRTRIHILLDTIVGALQQSVKNGFGGETGLMDLTVSAVEVELKVSIPLSNSSHNLNPNQRPSAPRPTGYY